MSATSFLVVGNPIAHSRSPEIHAHFAAQFGIEMTYERQLVELGGFADFLAHFAAQGGRGMNVTLPFKRDAHDAVTRLDSLAAGARAVNTIAIRATGGALDSEGFNTDGGGLIRDLIGRHGVSMQGANVLLLGAGGAAQGVLASLLAEAPAQLCVANRTLSRAQALVAQADAAMIENTKLSACPLGIERPNSVRPDIIINATSFGFRKDKDSLERTADGNAAADHAIVDTELGLDADWVGDAFCYDMSYGPGALFHRWAQVLGQGQCADGLGMLIEQAALSFEIWHGLVPNTDALYAQFQDMTSDGEQDG